MLRIFIRILKRQTLTIICLFRLIFKIQNKAILYVPNIGKN